MPHPGGRPTKYNPDFVNELDNYLKTCGKEQTSLPTIEGFALFLGVHRDTLYEWADKKDDNGKLIHPEFSDTLKDLEQIQKQQLIDDGIYGGKEVNATIVKLMLMNNHGMREKSDFTSDDDKIQSVDISIILNKVYGDKSTSSSEMPSNS